MAFTVHQGRVLRDGVPFTALGVNYHPSQAGCRLWSEWNPQVVKEDFRRMAADGLNTVRLFLFWRDFMPRPDDVDEEALARLEWAVAAADEAGLACVLSLLTIWMNGQLLEVPWRAGRSPWRDPELLRAEEMYVRAVARVVRPHDNVLALDLGDELWNIDMAEARRLSRDDVAVWQRRLADAIRQEAPGILVTQADDASGVFGPEPYGSDNGAALDLVGVHGFPPWAPVPIPSTMSYEATNLVPFLARFASAHGTAMVDELGSYGVDERTAAAYLGATAASLLAGGAAGALVWCWQDLASRDEPYRERPQERRAGLHHLDGTPKPAMHTLRKVVRAADDLALRRAPASTLLYLPERVRGRGHSYLDGPGSVPATFQAYLMLKRAHLDFDLVTGEPPERAYLVCPAPTRLTLTDIERLTAFADRGGTVYLSLGDHLHAFPGPEFVGAELVDYELDPVGKSALRWDGGTWPLDWTTATVRPTTLRATTARVLATYPDNSPALLEHRVGAGKVLFSNAPTEQQSARPGALTGAPWEEFHRRLARRAGVAPLLDGLPPDVEIVSGTGRGGPRTVLINHGRHPVRLEHGDEPGRSTELAAKEWTVIAPEEAEGAPR
ncbi:MAG: cellulase family glycosylhydrolase [Streptomyces sp.]|nr:cellulase family glycosylhydrolase [Streptomyces sp.]NUS11142.1 cellulase family glycosylhydrolase [Streptomyces sp.]NUS23666.1 cellulase family glycosylhydrolase [Streptomyces sp.]NUS76394.1 cellulase family glycosylhydrolase [Streptomyces sp.]